LPFRGGVLNSPCFGKTKLNTVEKDMTMAIEITNRFPLPAMQTVKKTPCGRKSDGRMDAISKLKVGESFHLDVSKSSASVLLWWAGARFPERDFTYRQEEGGGVRVWRSK
jgi:hypothetical protein